MPFSDRLTHTNTHAHLLLATRTHTHARMHTTWTNTGPEKVLYCFYLLVLGSSLFTQGPVVVRSQKCAEMRSLRKASAPSRPPRNPCNPGQANQTPRNHTHIHRSHPSPTAHMHLCTFNTNTLQEDKCDQHHEPTDAPERPCTTVSAHAYRVLDAAAKINADAQRALAGKPLDDCSQLMQVVLRLHPCPLRVLHARNSDGCVRKIATTFDGSLRW